MPTPFPSARHQAALSTPTGYRRWMRFTFTRGGESIDLEPVSGRLTQDVRRDGRWDGNLSFVGNDLLPTRPGDILTPFGTKVTATLGIELLDGSVSMVPYGVYEISSARTGTRAGERTVEVGLADISGIVDRYRFETPFTATAGWDLARMINAVVTNRAGVNPAVPDTGATLQAQRIFGLDTETGPWAELLDVLSGYSRIASYDRVGNIAVAATNSALADAYPLTSQASASAEFDTRPPNVVVARGEAQDGTTPVQAVAIDSDPSSPTYAGTGPGTSPYGRVTRYYASPLLLTTAQAQSAANSILAQNIGAGATYAMTIPYDPTVNFWDVISVKGSARVVDAVSIDLTGDTTLQVRELG